MKEQNLTEMLGKLEIYRAYITEEIQKTEFPDSPADLYDAIKYVLNLGGKRMRPILSMMACELFSGEFKSAKGVALGVEIFHNFTLIHDDIMDHAPLRRGKETVHQKWNERVAILSGDTLMIQSYILLANYKPELLTRLLPLYNTAAIEVCEGQQMDMDFELLNNVSIDDYIIMIRKKTAVLLGCSLQLGALVGSASDEDAQDLYDFGTNLGVAFQLQDDILDVYADQSKFGKQVGGDIIANKKTFLLLTAMQQANPEQRANLERLFTEMNHTKKVSEIKKLYSELNIKEQATNRMELFYQTAIDKLKAIQMEETKKEPLKALAAYLLSRES